VLQPESVNHSTVVHELTRVAPDMIFSFYFRQILSPEVLRLARHGAFNLHGSLLPRYRGRCPVNWVLVNGERETGVTLHHMEPKPDTGDIVAQGVVPIADDDTALTLNRKLGESARALLREVFPRLLAGTAPRIPQDPARASCFPGRGPEDGRIAWHQSARRIYDLVRAVTHPYPGAFTIWRGERLRVWRARPDEQMADADPGRVLAVSPRGIVTATGAGTVILEQVQYGGADEEDGHDLAARLGLVVGDHLGGEDQC
jgi:methionyl-tRNA formyltransferase